MSERFNARLQTLQQIQKKRWFRIAEVILACIALWDLFGAQLVSATFQQKLPRFFDVVLMTTGFLPWWAWGWLLTAVVAIAAVEYATRMHLLTAPDGRRARTVARLQISLDRDGIYTIEGSDNIRHVEPMNDGTFHVEFSQPVPARGLVARVSGTDRQITIWDVTRHRVKMAPVRVHLRDSETILFETQAPP